MNKKKKELLLKILLSIENIEPGADSKNFQFEGYTVEDIENILEIAYDEGLFKGIEAHSKDGKNWLQMRLTIAGMNIVEDYRNNLKSDILKAALDDGIGIAPIKSNAGIGELVTINKQKQFKGKEYIEAFRDLTDMGYLVHESGQLYRISSEGKNFIKDPISTNMSIFMSHISEEVKISLTLKKWIETKFGGSYKVFVSSEPGDLPPGSRWLENIESAIDNAKIIIVLCSPESIKRPWISFEAGAGWIKRKPVVPICHSGLKVNTLPMPLSNFQALDMEHEDFPENLFDALSTYFGKVELSQISFSDMKGELSTALVSIKPKQLGTIEFKSSSLEEEGWKINVEEKNDQSPEFNIIDDGYWGKVLKINLPVGDFMDHPVQSAGESTKSIEFIIKVEGSWALYSEIQVISSNRPTTRNVWLAFKEGSDDPKPFEDGEY